MGVSLGVKLVILSRDGVKKFDVDQKALVSNQHYSAQPHLLCSFSFWLTNWLTRYLKIIVV